jgi:tetratricopeptide (TPR) repeat protein
MEDLTLKRTHLLVTRWRGRAMYCEELQAILDQELAMSDLVHSVFEDFTLSRRKALLTLASLSAGLIASVREEPTSLKLLEQFLPQCAASITACTHLMQGNDVWAVEKALKQYMTVLEAVALRPSLYQQAAARLAAQAYQLQAILAHHRLGTQGEIENHKKAVDYSRISQDPNLQAVIISGLGNMYASILKQPEQAMLCYQEVLQYESALSPLVRSLLTSRVAFVQAQLGQPRDALASLDTVQRLLPDRPKDDPGFILVASGGLTQMYTGWTYFELSQPHNPDVVPNGAYLEQAWAAYTQVLENPQSSVSGRVRYQIVNHQTKVALGQRDLEKFCYYFMQGLNGAKALKSPRRKQEVVENWKAGKKVWGTEPRIMELAEPLMEQ